MCSARWTTRRERRCASRTGRPGKPFLLDDPQLHFNVSHSEDIAVIAVTRVGEVGIDVERQREMADMDDVARLVFNEAERTALLACPTASARASSTASGPARKRCSRPWGSGSRP